MKMTLESDLIRDEGLRLKPYTDTVGKQTIGVGRNLDDRGITEAEAMMLLDNDIEIVRRELVETVGGMWFYLPNNVHRALLNMAFNMGVPRLMGFKKMWAALTFGTLEKAADEALDSKWARQVGDRAERIATLIRNG
ncbi:glycoside hydrolase family protein [Candidatus Pacearchaeota archaeon]|nr:glycoside hydrolase family protein [Candidatus Pacearchaeota archaeon]